MSTDKHQEAAAGARRSRPRRSPQRRDGAPAVSRGQARRITALAALGIIVIIAGMAAYKLLGSGGATGVSPSGEVPPAVLDQLSGVPQDVFDRVGQGTVQNLPAALKGEPPLVGPTGKPQVLYVGAEYCPFCAAQRWALIVALSRFGSFNGLRASHSASEDVYPDTPTFTFYGSTYQSAYLDFVPVELRTNQKVGGTYQPLQTLTADQQQVLDRYDRPPFVPQAASGSIPFLDIANRFIISGSSFSPALLSRQSPEKIAASLSDPNSEHSKAIVGAANVMTAAICVATGNAPAEVCGQTAVKQIQGRLQ